MRVLIACEFSGIVRDAFIARGHDAWSCDLLPSEGKPLGYWYPEHYPPGHKLHDHQQHFMCDVREILPGGRTYHTMALEGQAPQWDLLIAHPPCTYLCRTSEQWLNKQPDRWQKMVDAVSFFKALLNAPVERICIENPQPNSHAARLLGVKYTQAIQPNSFGDPATKRTCLWLKNLPPLVWQERDDLLGKQQSVEPEFVYSKSTGRKWGKWFWESSMLQGEARAKFRSKTFPGIANAMANTWG